MTNSPYSALFQPIRIGPVTARNRFYQVPHCTGMGYRYPRSEARHRGIKAEGGWAVVSTQEAEIHKSSDISPANESRLWDDADIPALQLMTEAVHEHGSLAAIQLVHNGLHTGNLYSRVAPIAPSAAPVDHYAPIQAREMSKRDIREFRQWHSAAAKRAVRAGFDIVYAYAGHDMCLLQHFLLQRHNHRSDEYGGSFTNRLRLFKEVVDETRQAIGDDCALAIRLAVDELLGSDGLQHQEEGREIIAALAEEPDLWDVNLSDWSNDSQTARFSNEGYQEPYTAFVKSVTTKPVVGVGRYTSPDTMLRLVKSGHLDFIGAARPSIADPFLPHKIESNQLEDIRECIGCNICVSGDNTSVPFRCTQNPAVGEEWRRDWHPEIITHQYQQDTCLVVGAGPAGLEAARVLAQRGFRVTVAEKTQHWGGRVRLEAELPGLSSGIRVRDWRMQQLQRLPNVSMYLDNEISVEDVLNFDAAHIAIATGAVWRTDGLGRQHRCGVPGLAALKQSDNASLSKQVISVDALLNDTVDLSPLASAPVVIYDDDHFYIASVLAEMLIAAGLSVTFVTPAPQVASWTKFTLEQARIQTRLLALGVTIMTNHQLQDVQADHCTVSCIYSGAIQKLPLSALLPVTARLPNDELMKGLHACEDEWADAGILSVKSLGDCYVPGLIAGAVHAGHAYGRSLGVVDRPLIKREDHPLHSGY